MIERILEIKGSNLLANNLQLTENQVNCRLSSDSTAGAGTFTVDNIDGLTIGKYAVIGNWGDANSKIIRIHTSVAPTGKTVALNAVTTEDYVAGTSLTIIDYDQVEFSVSTTEAGAKTILNTTTAINIQANSENTTYNAVADSVYIATTTIYVWMRFKNSATTTYSDYSSTLLKSAASRSYDILRLIFDKALRSCKEKIGVTITYDDALDFAEDFFQELYAYKRSWRMFREIDTSKTTTSGTNYIDYPSDTNSIENIRYKTLTQSLVKVSSADQWNKINLITQSGDPYYYYIVKNKIYLFPTPDAAQTIYITQYYQPIRLTSIDGTIDCTRNGLFLMGMYFRYRIYDKVGNKDSKSKECANKFYAMLEQIGGQEELEAIGDNDSVEVTKDYMYEDDIDNNITLQYNS